MLPAEKTRMIRTSGTRYNYCSQIPVTPRCVGQAIFYFCTCGMRHQNSIPVKSAHMCFWREAYQMKCTSPRFLDAKYGMSEPDDWLFTDWHAPSHTACQLLLLYLPLYHIYKRHSPVHDLFHIHNISVFYKSANDRFANLRYIPDLQYEMKALNTNFQC